MTIWRRRFRLSSSIIGFLSLIRQEETTSRAREDSGILRSDLLVINKTDLAPYVGADIDLMVTEGNSVRGGRPVILTNCKTGEGVEAVVDQLINDVIFTV